MVSSRRGRQDMQVWRHGWEGKRGVGTASRWFCEDLEEELPFTERGPPRAEGDEEVALDVVPLRCLSDMRMGSEFRVQDGRVAGLES